jgi:hypothetical protein
MVVFIAKSPISASTLDSSSSPISSKFPTSERTVLSSDWYDEWKEDDLDDFEDVRSGGEPGIGECIPASWKLIASSNGGEDAGDVRVRCRVAILAVGVVVLGMEGQCFKARDRTTPERCVGWIAVAKAARQIE